MNQKPHQDKIEEIVNSFNDSFGIEHFRYPRTKQSFRNFLRTSLASYGSFIEGEIRREIKANTTMDFCSKEEGRQEVLEEIKRRVEEMETFEEDGTNIENDRVWRFKRKVLALLEKDNTKCNCFKTVFDLSTTWQSTVHKVDCPNKLKTND